MTDLRQEHLRKSDHLNPLRDIPELEQVAHAAGFRIGRIRYYTPIVGGFVENILMRDRRARDGAARRGRLGPISGEADADAQAIRAARKSAKERIANSPADLRSAAGIIVRHEARPAAVRPNSLGSFLCLAGERVSDPPAGRLRGCGL